MSVTISSTAANHSVCSVYFPAYSATEGFNPPLTVTK